MFAVPVVKSTMPVPAPATDPVKAYVPVLPKLSVAPVATENEPGAALILERDRFPVFAATVPEVLLMLLLKGTLTVAVPVPAVFSRVPALLNVV